MINQFYKMNYDNRYLSMFNNIEKHLEAKMFLDDFCLSFSISLSSKFNDTDFYYTENQTVYDLFGYKFLRYDLDSFLSNILINLILFGKAYALRIQVNDDKKKNIRYECINCVKIKETKSNLICYYLNDKNRSNKVTYNKENVLFFDLKQLGYSRKYFYSKIKKLFKIDYYNVDFNNKNFDFEKMRKTNEKIFLKSMKKIWWNSHNVSEYSFNEPYILYRSIKNKELKNQFLKYFIEKINEDIYKIDTIKADNGKIKVKSNVDDYLAFFDEFKIGKINCEQLSAKIYKY